ncbi:hypothetical protein [Peribacillus alkalitolerans]|uniref:hypothetical protein n=1 Tax=Peribacillus alkalitolerans TaxID=1550385 RepID=UPI001F0748E2|nr:hypothetical protein [Peribacillus alkalitolerans]
MAEPQFRMRKIWEDYDDFYEVNLELIGNDCSVDIQIYLDNEQLEKLQIGLESFTKDMGKKVLIWISGSENVSNNHYVSMRFFLQEKRGIVGVEIFADNKRELPYKMRSHFYILTEIGQLDDLAWKLKKFIYNKDREVNSLIYPS